MCNLSEGIEKVAYKEGFQIGRILILSSCVKKGFITLEEAVEYSEMSVEEFLQKVEEYKECRAYESLMALLLQHIRMICILEHSMVLTSIR